ncbi:MAG: hypothetical protein R3E63_04235 [Pseudomonadales bacterium]
MAVTSQKKRSMSASSPTTRKMLAFYRDALGLAQEPSIPFRA